MKRHTLAQIVNQGTSFLKKYNVDNAKFDAELLLMNVLEYDRLKLLTNLNTYIEETVESEYMKLLKQRANGKPTQYILGNQEFMGMSFFVNQNVLIPRQDTETLVEIALKYIKKENHEVIMDIGTGTGCIPISLCRFIPEIQAIGVDISKQALKIAKKNAKINGVNKKIVWINSSLFDNICRDMYNSIDVIISNPPYIPTKDINNLMVEVKEYEPITALDGGEDGLKFYRKIVVEALKYLNDNGRIFFEVGYNQSQAVVNILLQNNYKDINVIKDLSGINRVVYAKKDNKR